MSDPVLTAVAPIVEASVIGQQQVVEHERDDEGNVYPNTWLDRPSPAT
jgi:hypothetical protein